MSVQTLMNNLEMLKKADGYIVDGKAYHFDSEDRESFRAAEDIVAAYYGNENHTKKLVIDTDEMDETMLEWFKQEIKENIDEHLGAASNEHLWSLGEDDKELSAQHSYYSDQNRHYADILKKAYDYLVVE